MKNKIIVIGGYAESLINFRGHFLSLLVQKGHQVIACAPDASEKVKVSLSRRGVTYYDVPIERTGMNPVRDLLLVYSLVRLFIKEKPDVCIFYTIKPVIFGSIAARIAGVDNMYSLITGLGYLFTNPKNMKKVLFRGVRFLYRLALSYNAKIFFQNPDDLAVFKSEKILAAHKEVTVVNGSGVDLEFYDYYPSSRQDEEQTQVKFLLIARLLEDKGIYEYVEAARIIKRIYPGCTFRLAGWFDSNPAAISRNEVEKWVEEGLIEYLGKLEDVRSALRQCSVYVLPSYREGTPRTVLEAMATGRAIVTTDVPGCRETVEDGINGYLVPSHDSEKLANAMELFILNPQRIVEMGTQSRKIATEKYDVHKVNQALAQGMRIG